MPKVMRCSKSSGWRETYSSNVYFRKERSQINNSALWKQKKKEIQSQRKQEEGSSKN